jgi:hypothetical protein
VTVTATSPDVADAILRAPRQCQANVTTWWQILGVRVSPRRRVVCPRPATRAVLSTGPCGCEAWWYLCRDCADIVTTTGGQCIRHDRPLRPVTVWRLGSP